MTIIPPAFPTTSVGGRLTAFWKGFVTPTPFALILMLSVFAATAVLTIEFVTPRMLAGPFGAFLPRSTKDNEAFATREALQLALAPSAAPTPRLYVIGDSIIAHDFASDKLTAEALAAATSEPWQVAVLTTPLQGPIDEAALAEFATKQQPGVVVLSMSFNRFGLKQDDLIAQYDMARLGLRSDWADEAVSTLGGRPQKRSGIYAIDNRNFLLRNANISMARMLVGRPAARRIDAYLLHPPLDKEVLARQRGAILKHFREAKPKPADDVGIKLLAMTVKRLQAQGNVVVFVESPISEALFEGPADDARYAASLEASAATARSLGARYCRLADRYQPAPGAFPDYIHLNDAGAQAKMRAALADCVVAAMDKKVQ